MQEEADQVSVGVLIAPTSWIDSILYRYIKGEKWQVLKKV